MEALIPAIIGQKVTGAVPSGQCERWLEPTAVKHPARPELAVAHR